MKSSTIAALTGNGTWNNRDGKLMYAFIVELHDGTHGECNSVSETPPYGVGDTVFYEQTGTSPKGTPKLKISKNAPRESGASYSYKKVDVVGIQWALNAARETLVSRGEEVTLQNLDAWAQRLIELRDEIAKNLES